MRDPLYIRCRCHQPHHFVLIEDDPDIDDVFNVSVVGMKSASFFQRLKWGLKHVLGTEHLTVADLVVDRSDADRIISYLKKA